MDLSSVIEVSGMLVLQKLKLVLQFGRVTSQFGSCGSSYSSLSEDRRQRQVMFEMGVRRSG